MSEAVETDLEKAKYARKIRNQIRRGVLPRYFFAKGKDDRLERDAKGHLTWRVKSTFKELTK